MLPTPQWQELTCQAILLRRTGQGILAIDKLIRSIELTKSVPELAKRTITSLNYLAVTYLEEGLLVEAEATAREALRREHEEPNPPVTAFADNLMILAKALHRQGRCDEAVGFGKQALAIYRRYLGWRSDYYRATKREVAGFRYPPADAPERDDVVKRAS